MISFNNYFLNTPPPSVSNVDYFHNEYLKQDEKNKLIYTNKTDIKTLKFNFLNDADRNYIIRALNLNEVREKIQIIINHQYKQIQIINNLMRIDYINNINISLSDDFIIHIYIEFKPLPGNNKTYGGCTERYNDYEEEILDINTRLFRELSTLNEDLILLVPQ